MEDPDRFPGHMGAEGLRELWNEKNETCRRGIPLIGLLKALVGNAVNHRLRLAEREEKNGPHLQGKLEHFITNELLEFFKYPTSIISH